MTFCCGHSSVQLLRRVLLSLLITNCFPRLPNLNIVYIISFLPTLPHTALTVFGKDSIITSYLMLNIHSIKTVSSFVVCLTFDDYDMTVMMICSSDDEFG